MPAITPEDVENLHSWLQQILKEVQDARGASQEAVDKLNSFPQVGQPMTNTVGLEQKIDELRSYMDSQLGKLESNQNELRNAINDVKSHVSKL